jgi:hypothetical protein
VCGERERRREGGREREREREKERAKMMEAEGRHGQATATGGFDYGTHYSPHHCNARESSKRWHMRRLQGKCQHIPHHQPADVPHEEAADKVTRKRKLENATKGSDKRRQATRGGR